jgi:MFS family permease
MRHELTAGAPLDASIAPEIALKAPPLSWLALAAVTLVSIYAVVDRSIFGLFAEPIRKTLHLSDAQIGEFMGVGLALVGVVTTYPISWLADRHDRRKIVAACIVLWSGAVVICALAPDFGWLMVGASLFGVGKAGIGPAGYAMIPDLFPPHARQIANSVFAM